MQALVSKIASKLAFFPPSPPSYLVKRHNDNGDEYIAPRSSAIRKVPNAQVIRLTTSRGCTIVAAWIPYSAQCRGTMLFSHGNAVDLGLMLPFYREIAKELRVNLLGYDYSGYGASQGEASVLNALADIEACYQWLTSVKGKQPNDIVLYGQSVGSGPTCHLGAKVPGLAGVILHSPLATGMRVMNPTWTRWPSWLDVFPNIKLISKISAPTLIMHGVIDNVVDISAGHALHAAALNPVRPLWAEECDHQNVEMDPMYVTRLKEFMRQIFK